jgi:hypothetical protein
MAQLLVEMDGKIHKQFKQVALTEDRTMAEVVRECIKKYLAEKTKTVVY